MNFIHWLVETRLCVFLNC